MTAELAHLEQQTSQPDFWNHAQKAAKISRKKSTIERDLQQWRDIDGKMNDLGALLELAEESGDAGLAKELTFELDQFEPKLAALRLELLLSGELDPNNAIVAIHPGAGGTESQDWAQMLLRMYVRWAESKKFKVETLDLLPGEEAGVKSVTLSVTGRLCLWLSQGRGRRAPAGAHFTLRCEQAAAYLLCLGLRLSRGG